MAKIEERVLSMKFDNAQFKRAAAETTSILGKLKASLKFDGVKHSLNDVAKASNSSLGNINKNASKVDLSPISRSVDEVSRSFTALEAISFGALATIGGTAATKAMSGIKKLWNMAAQPIVQGGMNRARNLEQANFMLSGLFSKLDDQARKSNIDQVMAAANNSVTGTAFGLDEAAKAAAQLTASQVPLEKLEGALRGIAGTASMTSSGFDEIANIFTTVAGNGRMMGQELAMLSSRGLNAAASIGEHLGVTEAEVREMASKGKISFEIFSDAMEGAFGKQAARANETYAGSLSNLRAAFGRIGADVAAVYLEKMRDLFNELRPAVNAVHGVLKPFIGLLNDRFRASIDSVIRPIQTFTTALEQFNKTGASSSKGWTTFFNLMQDIGMIASLVADVIRDAIGVMFGASPRFIEMSDTVTSAGTKIQHIFRKLLSVLMLGPEIIGHIFRAVLGLSDTTGSFGGTLLDIIDHFASMLYLTAEWIRKSTVIQTVIQIIAFGIRQVIKVATAVAKTIGFFLGLIVKLYSSMSPIFNGIFRLISKVKDAAEKFFGILSDFRTGVISKFGSTFVEWFGRIFDSIKKLDIKDVWKSIRSFKLPKIDLSSMEHLSKFVSAITGGFDKLKSFVGTIDWSPLTNIFTKMQMPNLGEISSLASSIGGGIRTGMSNISADPLKNFANNVRNHVGNAVRYLRDVDYAAVWATTTSVFKDGVSKVGDIMLTMGTWIVDAVQSIDWDAVGTFLVDGLVSAVKMTIEAADTVATFVSDMFTKAFEAIDWDGIVDGVLDFGDKMKDSFTDMFDSLKGKTVDTDALEDSINAVPKDITVNVKRDLDAQTKGLRETVSDFFGALFGTGVDINPEESEVIAGAKTFGDSVKNISATLGSPFASAKKAVNAEIGGFGSTLKEASANLLEGFDLVGVLNGMGLAFTGAGIFSLAESVEKLAAVPETLNKTLKSIGDSFKSIGDAAKIEAQGNAILKIAGALAIMAAAVWFLSKIPWDQMKVGLGAVLGLLGALVASVYILDKTISEDGSKKINELANAMMKMGIAVGIMAAAVWLLGNMDPATILQGLGAALGTLLVLVGGTALAGMTKTLTGMGTAFMGLALGVAILAGAFLMFKFINWDEIIKGLTTLGVAVLGISLAARIADGKKLAGAGLAMLGLGTGLYALAYGLKAVADLDEQQLTQGLLVLGGVMVGLTVMSRFGGKLTATVGALIGISFALIALAYAIGLIAAIDFGAAFGSMVTLTVGLILMGAAMRAFPKDMPAIAGSLLGIAGALAILVAAIWIIGNMDGAVVAQGVAVLAGALLSLGVALYFMKPTAGKDMMVLGAGMVVLAGSMLILAFAMKMFNEVEWDALYKAGAVLAAVLVTLALMGLFGTAAAPGISALGGALAVLGGGLLVIAGAAWVFADAVSKIVDALNNLKDNGLKIKAALKSVGEGITLFAEEAKAGFESLFETIGLTDLPKIGSLVKLFESFGKIPQGMDVRLSELATGMESLKAAIPVIESLSNTTQSGGKHLTSFFNSLSDIEPDAGANLESLANTLRGFDDTFFTVLDKLITLGPKRRDSTELSDFFRAYDDLDPDTGENLLSLANTLKQFDDGFFTILQRLIDIGPKTRDARELSDFFRAYDDLDADTGENLGSLVKTIKQFDDGFFTTLQKLIDLGPTRGDSTELSDFFRAYDDLDADTGENLLALANTIKQFDGGFFEILNKLINLGPTENDSEELSNFFRAFSGINSESGEKLLALVNTLKQFDEGFFGTLQRLIDLGPTETDAAELTNFFGAFNNISADSGTKLLSMVEALKQFDEGFFIILGNLTGFEGNASSIVDLFTSIGGSVNENMGSNLSGAVSGIKELGDVIPDLKAAIESLEGLDTEGLGNIMTNINEAFAGGVGDSLSGVADEFRTVVDGILSAVTDRSADFTTAGGDLGRNLSSGIDDKKIDAENAGKNLAQTAVSAARAIRSEMVAAGRYVASGLAEGIRAGADAAVAEARTMANRVAAAAKVALDEHSPSRVFIEIGQFVSQGFAIGIEKDSHLATKAIGNTMDDAIDIANGKTGELKGATGGFYDTLIKDFNNNPFTKRLEQLAKHSKAAHATAVKERKLEDMEKLEKAEEERKKIYKDVEEAKKSIAEAKEETKTAQNETKKAEKDTKDSAADSAKAAKDAQKQKEKITDAEERYQKAVRERDKYEYRMHGEEAGVAFVDGVAEGLMDDTEAIPTIAEILSELLLKEADDLKTRTNEYTDIFSGFEKVLTTTKSMGDHIRDLSRAFTRLDNATSPRSIQRNIEKILGSIVGFMGGIQDLIGVLSILEPFLPSLLGMFEASLPGIAAAVAPFAPALAAQLGGGLTSALPAIMGPAGMIIAAIAGIGIFLNDQANGGNILKGVEKMFKGVVKFMVGLPKKILGAIQTLFKGLKNTLRDLPRIMTTLINGIVDFVIGLIDVIPDVIPELINSIVELVAWVVLNAPALVLEIGAALIMGLVRGLDKAMKSMVSLLLSPFEWLTGRIGGKLDLFKIAGAAIQSLGRGLDNAVRASIQLLLWPFKSLFNLIGSVFGMDDLGTRIVAGFEEGVVGAMRFAVDAIAFPFIGLYNLIAGIFGWEKLAYDAASDFIFGTSQGIDSGKDTVRNSAENINRMMYEYLKSGAKNNLADVAGYVDDYMKLVETGMVDGVELGADATRNIADDAWRDIEKVFDMYGLGTDELDALTKAFYEGTTNPDTIVSSFGDVYDRIEELLAMKGVGPEMVEDLNKGLNTSLRQGMLNEAMDGFGKFGTNSAFLLTDSMVKELGLSKEQIVAASDDIWRNIEDVFDMAGLGKEEVEALKAAYEEGTKDPEKFASTFDEVFAAVEKKLRLAGMGEDQIAALKYSMSTAITKQLNPELEEKTAATEGIFKGVFSEKEGKSLGESIVSGLISAITSPFRKIWDTGVSWVGNLVGGINSVIEDVPKAARSVANKALSALGSIWDGATGIFSRGVNFVGGLIKGIQNQFDRFAQEVKNLAKSALDLIGLGWLIKSPSRKGMELSAYLVEGLVMGITNNATDLDDAVETMGDNVLDTTRAMIEQIAEAMELDSDVTITPVIDLTNARKGARELNGLIDKDGLSINSAVAGTADLASVISGEEPTGGNVTNITNVEFNQTNTSPEPLSAYEIYTNTERGLTTLKLSGPNR